MDKSFEYWAAIAGMAIYTAIKKPPFYRSLARTASSALLTLALSRWVAEFAGISEAMAVVIIMAVGLTFLDLAIAIATDETFIKEIVRSIVLKGKR